MDRNEIAVLRDQIQALSGNIEAKFSILQHLFLRGPMAITDIEKLLGDTVKDATLYNYFRDLVKAQLVVVVNEDAWPKEYRITQRGIAELITNSLRDAPKLRWVDGNIHEWSEERIVADLKRNSV